MIVDFYSVMKYGTLRYMEKIDVIGAIILVFAIGVACGYYGAKLYAGV